jgi:anthranilate phosphoribosyltransferase
MSAIAIALDALIDERRDLLEAEAAAACNQIMSGEATPAQTAALLTALRLKGETVDEITGFARTMRTHALRVELPGVARVADTAGTGGDGQHTFNVSTAAAFVVAGCGVPVAKHGNRAASSSCGSADVLEALGARIDLDPTGVAATIAEVGFGFMFAPAFHPAMKHVAPVRRELGFRTIFNILGPLTNPAGSRHQMIGVPTPEIGEKMARVLDRLGSEHVLVVHGHEGLDEVSPTGLTAVWEMKGGVLRQYEVSPDDFRIRPVSLSDVAGGEGSDAPAVNAKAMREVLSGKIGPLTGFVTLNAAAALLAADEVPTFAEGVSRAAECIDDGRALRKLERFVTVSQELGAKQ